MKKIFSEYSHAESFGTLSAQSTKEKIGHKEQEKTYVKSKPKTKRKTF